MRLSSFIIAAASFTLAACASTNAPTGPVVYSLAEAEDSVRVRAGQTLIVDGIRIRFNAVENDSRCPADVVCVWEGDAIVSLAVEQNCECRSLAFELRLHTSLEPRAGAAWGYRVELRGLTPQPRVSSPIKPEAYVAWLRVVRVEG